MILEVKDLHVHYGRIGHLANLSFAVDAGEILCIRCPVLQFGTVLLWALIGAGERIEGRIRFDGENLAGPLSPAKLLALREHIAMVYRERGLISLLTVGENIALPLGYHYNVDRRKLADAVHDVADALRISTLLDRDAEDIREMDTRLVNLARALIRRPRLILIDGLLEGMPGEREFIFETIKTYQEKDGFAVIMTARHSGIEHATRAFDLTEDGLKPV
jgi:ABC-type branched-subunit amino acid transport system ATPase component